MNLVAPLGLLLGLLALPLLALYFLRIRRQRVVVPSILLWEALAKDEKLARPFDRFRQNLLLWLQLLALLAIVLAFARPYLDEGLGTARAVVLVVDVSASMAATDERPTRLAAAVAKARSVVSGLGPSDEATLVVAGPRTEVVVPFTHEQARLHEALNALEPSQARATLREGVQLGLSLARARSGVEIHVFSDGGGASMADLPAGQTPIVYERVGRNSGNSGILALDLRSAPSSELDRQAFVTVQHFGVGTAEATVQLFLDEQLVGLRNATLGGEPTSMVFDLPSASSGVLRAELKADDDHLPLDDTAWAIVEPVRKRRVVLVGGDRLTERVLASDPRVELTRRRAATLTTLDVEQADALFLAEDPGRDLTGLNVAWLGPDVGGPVTFGERYDNPQVLGWQRTHPLLRFVAFDGVRLAQAHTVLDPGGLSAIAESTGGPLVLAGERAGGREVQLAFDPLKTDLPLRVAWPVFVLNTVGWLSQDRAGVDHGHVVTAGAPWVRRVGSDTTEADVRVTGPDATKPAWRLGEGLLRVQDTTRLGVYDVRFDGTRARFASNLAAPGESDLTPKLTLDIGTAAQAGSTQAGIAAPSRQDLWRPLLLLALAVLVVEWIVWTRRGRGGQGVVGGEG